MYRKSLRAVLATSLVATLLALAPATIAKPSAEAWRDELPVLQPYLRGRLPADAVAYLRMPDIFGLVATPKGNVLDGALRSKANVENVQRIRAGLIENVLAEIPQLQSPQLNNLLMNLRSPIEVAVFTAPAPSALIAMNVGVEDVTELTDALSALGGGQASFQLAAPLDERGVGMLAGAGMPIYLQFAAETGQLLLNAGPAVTAETFDQVIAEAGAPTPHQMRAMENKIDESGQGLFLWADTSQLLPLLSMFLPPEEYANFTELGLDKVESLALGWGVAGGKGRFAITANLAEGQDRGFLPVINNDLGARSAGEPDGMVLLSLPTPEEFARLEAKALALTDVETAAGWQEIKATIRAEIGVSLEEFFQAMGPDLVLIFDRAGDYAALKLRDPKLFDSVIDRVVAATGATLEEKRIGRHRYTHLASAPAGMPEDDEDAENGMPEWMLKLAGREREHVYWTSEGDYLYFAATPQALIDRAARKPRTELGEWLATRQRMDASHAVLSASGKSDKLPRRFYSAYLEIMQYLADLGQAEMDMWSMPTPAQLGLPDEGTLGMSLNMGEPGIGLELTFENNPAEMLGGMGGVAMIGIAAAVAIPAYQDYTNRAKVSEGLALAAQMQSLLADYYAVESRFPNAQEAADLSIAENAGMYTRSIIVEPFTGIVVIEFSEGALPEEGKIYLQPEALDDGTLSWRCTATIPDKLVPAECRQQ